MKNAVANGDRIFCVLLVVVRLFFGWSLSRYLCCCRVRGKCGEDGG